MIGGWSERMHGRVSPCNRRVGSHQWCSNDTNLEAMVEFFFFLGGGHMSLVMLLASCVPHPVKDPFFLTAWYFFYCRLKGWTTTTPVSVNNKLQGVHVRFKNAFSSKKSESAMQHRLGTKRSVTRTHFSLLILKFSIATHSYDYTWSSVCGSRGALFRPLKRCSFSFLVFSFLHKHFPVFFFCRYVCICWLIWVDREKEPNAADSRTHCLFT